MAYKYLKDWDTGPVRIRLLRYWSRAVDSMQGYWLITIEPRWPIVRISYGEHLDENAAVFPTKDDYTFDVILEHYKPNGSCNGAIFVIDLYDLAGWMK